MYVLVCEKYIRYERERERERERVGMERHCKRLCACDLKEGMAVCERGKR